jgi:hypothetical protein
MSPVSLYADDTRSAISGSLIWKIHDLYPPRPSIPKGKSGLNKFGEIGVG